MGRPRVGVAPSKSTSYTVLPAFGHVVELRAALPELDGVVQDALESQLGGGFDVRLASPLMRADCPVSVYLASSSQVQAENGLLFARRRPVDLRPHSEDLETARRLWEASERLTGAARLGYKEP